MTEVEIRRIPGTEFFEDGEPHPDAYGIRKAVFVDEQGVPEELELDGKDESATHFVAYNGGRAVGTARLRILEDGEAKPERIAVEKPFRKRGIARQLMETVEMEAIDCGCVRAVLHAQTAVQEFYEGLGYDVCSDVFDEAGIPHVEMVKQLE